MTSLKPTPIWDTRGGGGEEIGVIGTSIEMFFFRNLNSFKMI